jgi:hypothetical protein
VRPTLLALCLAVGACGSPSFYDHTDLAIRDACESLFWSCDLAPSFHPCCGSKGLCEFDFSNACSTVDDPFLDSFVGCVTHGGTKVCFCALDMAYARTCIPTDKYVTTSCLNELMRYMAAAVDGGLYMAVDGGWY